MKHTLLFLLSILLFSCSKQAEGPADVDSMEPPATLKDQSRLEQLTLGDELQKEHQLSSLDEKQGIIYTISEVCGELLKLKLDGNSLKITGRLNLKEPLGIPKPDIEAVAVYKNTLFITDEQDKNLVKAIDLRTERAIEVMLPKELENLEGESYGFEGMEANEKLGLLYVLREKDNIDRHTILYTLKIKESPNRIELSLMATTKISHANTLSERCPALALSSDQKSLYLLRTSKGHYFVDQLRLNAQHLPVSNMLMAKDLQLFDISSAVEGIKGRSSNIEGLASIGNKLMLISDDGGSGCSIARAGKATLACMIHLD